MVKMFRWPMMSVVNPNDQLTPMINPDQIDAHAHQAQRPPPHEANPYPENQIRASSRVKAHSAQMTKTSIAMISRDHTG